MIEKLVIQQKINSLWEGTLMIKASSNSDLGIAASQPSKQNRHQPPAKLALPQKTGPKVGFNSPIFFKNGL